MSLPPFSSPLLEKYKNYSSEQEQFKALTFCPKELILFFEEGLNDLAWAQAHQNFLLGF